MLSSIQLPDILQNVGQYSKGHTHVICTLVQETNYSHPRYDVLLLPQESQERNIANSTDIFHLLNKCYPSG